VKAILKGLRKYVGSHATLLNILVKYGIGLALLAWIVIANWKGIVGVFSRPFYVGPLLLATAIAVAGLIITFLRWHLLVRAIDMPFTKYNAIRLGLVGYFFNTFLPGSIGGDIVKSVAMAREQDRRTLAVATVLVDRIIGLWALVWFVAIIGAAFWIVGDPLLSNPSLWAIVLFSMIFVGVSVAIWYLLGFLSDERAARIANRLEKVVKIGGSLAELWRACWMYRKRSRAVLIAMMMSMVGHIGWVLVFHYTVHAFVPNDPSEIASLPEHMIVVPVGMTVSAIGLVPGGIGVGEKAYETLYKAMGKAIDDNATNYGIVGCFAQRIIFFTIGFVGYLIYTRMRRSVDQKDAKTAVGAAPTPQEPLAPGLAGEGSHLSPSVSFR
jgi:glycosyltransferase 2 family protein